MKIGDLVSFYARGPFSSSNRDYKNPGIVVEIEKNYFKYNTHRTRISAQVLWSDGRVTSEHECYLRQYEK